MDLIAKAKTAKPAARSKYHQHWWDTCKEDHPEVAKAICELILAWKADELPAYRSRRQLIMEIIIPNLPDGIPKPTVNWMSQMPMWDAQVCKQTLEELGAK